MQKRRAITILEALVVIVICVCALGLAVMLIARHRENAQRMQCTLNLKVMGDAFHAYHTVSSPDEARRYLPPSRIADGYATWGALIAPYLAKDHALAKWDTQISYFAQTEDVRQARLIYFFCPSRSRTDTLSQFGDLDGAKAHFPGGLGDYANVAGDGFGDWTSPKANAALVSADGIERKGERIVNWHSMTGLASLPRGTAYTMLVGEKHVPIDRQGDAEVGDGSFYNGQNPASYSRVAGPGFPIAPSVTSPFNRNFGSYHHGICNFLMADTSVRTMTFQTSEAVLGQLARRTE